MIPVKDYSPVMKENEEVFRNILRDLKGNRTKRPMGILVPEDLQTEIPLKEIFNAYSAGNRYGIFTVCDFQREKEGALLAFKNVACMSGGGAVLEYIVGDDNSVRYKGHQGMFMS